MDGLARLLDFIYPDHDQQNLLDEIKAAFWPEGTEPRQAARIADNDMWSEKDNYLITYGGTIIDGEHKPLDLLRDFATKYLSSTISGIHILPYFPYTSDDGFAVTDYREVNSTLGAWEDIERIGSQFKLMSDLVLNHCSSQSTWFSEYLQGHEPYDKFFFEASPEDDLSDVVRPRAHELLRRVETANGTKHVWCTFSHDQVDFDFRNPAVLIEFIKIMRLHIDKGVRTIRLDAVAFVWKVIGTNCIHLDQTHAIVKLMRLLCDYCIEPVIIVTETNVPKTENLSYFGNRNEAHMVYNFSLPPLLVQALLKGTSKHLNAWQMSMPPAQMGCAYFNFTASHDGIGLRPAEGIIPSDDLDEMVETVLSFGGRISMRTLPDGTQKAYELNTSLFDALKGTITGEDDLQAERFICSQTIAMGLEGVPAFYIHSLLSTHNDQEGVEQLGHNRAINRKRLDYGELRQELDNPSSQRTQLFGELKRRIELRSTQSAFHPNATQFTLQLGDQIFGFWRQSIDRSQSIFALSNLTKQDVTIPTIALNLIDGDHWTDILSSDTISSADGDVLLAPYQTRWISNRLSSDNG
jgi:sucrose phosphorylase